MAAAASLAEARQAASVLATALAACPRDQRAIAAAAAVARGAVDDGWKRVVGPSDLDDFLERCARGVPPSPRADVDAVLESFPPLSSWERRSPTTIATRVGAAKVRFNVGTTFDESLDESELEPPRRQRRGALSRQPAGRPRDGRPPPWDVAARSSDVSAAFASR